MFNQNDDVELTVNNGIGLLDTIIRKWARFEREVPQCTSFVTNLLPKTVKFLKNHQI